MADASCIAVVSSLALKGVLEEFQPAFERSLAARLELRFDATQAILAHVGSLRADPLVLTAEAMADLRNAARSRRFAPLAARVSASRCAPGRQNRTSARWRR